MSIQNKIDHMLDHGFKLHKCPRRNIHTLEYKDYEWTFDDILNYTMEEINESIRIYDEED